MRSPHVFQKDGWPICLAQPAADSAEVRHEMLADRRQRERAVSAFFEQAYGGEGAEQSV